LGCVRLDDVERPDERRSERRQYSCGTEIGRAAGMNESASVKHDSMRVACGADQPEPAAAVAVPGRSLFAASHSWAAKASRRHFPGRKQQCNSNVAPRLVSSRLCGSRRGKPSCSGAVRTDQRRGARGKRFAVSAPTRRRLWRSGTQNGAPVEPGASEAVISRERRGPQGVPGRFQRAVFPSIRFAFLAPLTTGTGDRRSRARSQLTRCSLR
jgi:hypothetical protein